MSIQVSVPLFSEYVMAKNRKKQRAEAAQAAAVKKKAEPPPPPQEPEVKRGPTEPKKKVKRPKYQRPPRTPAPDKPKVAVEDAGPKAHTFASLTLRQAVAKSLPKPGTKLAEDRLPGRL
jgi:hypothetical protein